MKILKKLISLLEKFVNKFKCDHDFVFVHNIYGDAINWYGGHRSYWECKKCGKPLYKDYLKEDYD